MCDGLAAMVSEDFRSILKRVAGGHSVLDDGNSTPVHNHLYDFDDGAIPLGAGLFARIL